MFYRAIAMPERAGSPLKSRRALRLRARLLDHVSIFDRRLESGDEAAGSGTPEGAVIVIESMFREPARGSREHATRQTR
jgi:hypothetical protein